MKLKAKVLLVFAAGLTTVGLVANDEEEIFVGVYAGDGKVISDQDLSDVKIEKHVKIVRRGSVPLDKLDSETDAALSEMRRVNRTKFMSSFQIDIAEQEANLRSLFDGTDKDGDGYLSLDEMRNSGNRFRPELSALPFLIKLDPSSESTPIRHEIVEKVVEKALETATFSHVEASVEGSPIVDRVSPGSNFDIADADGDGLLTREEFENRRERSREHAVEIRLNALDVNGDGYLEFNEYATILDRYRNADTDHDGIVSTDELSQSMAQDSTIR